MNAEVFETHTGIVVLVGDRAYKVKKPVVTDFLDFSSVERREQVCAREVELNRRLAPESYLGIAHFDNAGQCPAEPVIIMRRHPDSLRLTTLVATDESVGDDVDDHIVRIAETLARFHERAERSPAIDERGTPPEITALWQENLTELGRYGGTILSTERIAEVTRLAARFISGRTELFAERIADRRIVDGHGDLRADDIFCLPEGPALLDCLEFDDRLRHVDCVDDAAFLVMDLEFLGRNDLAAKFRSHYVRLTSGSEPNSLWHFYISYRAVVRAKVDCIRFDQGVTDARSDAQRHLDIALTHLRSGTVRLVLVGGGPGTGKTTLARALSERMKADVISTDDVRRELLESGIIEGSEGVFGGGLYLPDNVNAVYEHTLRRAATALARGRSVILDGTWRDAGQRLRAAKVADEYSCPTVELVCEAPLSEAMDRISRRSGSTSDATPAIAAAMASDDHSWSTAHRIDTTRSLAESVHDAYELCCRAT
ncbi:AAA family ATPase [Mycobacterium sp. 141]|uniref:bifunctional aminoglycoside phosphotransferase/ATP-binding protein n=1 Tax=Mycobacterium sp. 141 TaxID=1120797 RepID=UPI0012DD201A|nr:AAA family ATPase [Mycobacterium sp. 141]